MSTSDDGTDAYFLLRDAVSGFEESQAVARMTLDGIAAELRTK